MHHFKIDIPSPDSLDTTMVKSPANVTKKANPLWDYWKYCIMDVASKDVAKFQKRLILWPPAPVKEEDKSEGDETKGNQAKEDDKNGVDMKKNNDKDKNNEGKRKRSVPKASIDADLDVVHFKFTSTLFDPFHLAGDKTRKTFAGIKHVAVDWKMTYSKWDLPAFVCCCRNRRHILGPVCPIAMAHWLSHFEDLQVFYIVLKIARSDVDEMGMYRAAEKRYQDELSARKEDPILQETIQDWSDSQVTLLREQKAQMKRPAAAVIREWMDHFRRRCPFISLAEALAYETHKPPISHSNTDIFFNPHRDCQV